MPLIASQLSYLPDFQGREVLYSSILGPNTFIIRPLTVFPNLDRCSRLEGSLGVQAVLGHGQRDKVEHSYTALSYYWGNADDLEDVTIHGTDQGVLGHTFQVRVSKSLATALRQLRARATSENEPLCLWTDALCIDQRNALERRYQVKIVHVIFALAKAVDNWLSDTDPVVEQGLLMLAQLSAFYGGNELEPENHHESALTLPGAVHDKYTFAKHMNAIFALPLLVPRLSGCRGDSGPAAPVLWRAP